MADNDWETNPGGTMDADIDTGLGNDQGSGQEVPKGSQKKRKGRKGGQVDRGSSDTGSGMGGDTGQRTGDFEDFSDE